MNRRNEQLPTKTFDFVCCEKAVLVKHRNGLKDEKEVQGVSGRVITQTAYHNKIFNFNWESNLKEETILFTCKKNSFRVLVGNISVSLQIKYTHQDT